GCARAPGRSDGSASQPTWYSPYPSLISNGVPRKTKSHRSATELYTTRPWRASTPVSRADFPQPLAGQVGLVARRVLPDHVLELHHALRALVQLQVGVPL